MLFRSIRGLRIQGDLLKKETLLAQNLREAEENNLDSQGAEMSIPEARMVKRGKALVVITDSEVANESIVRKISPPAMIVGSLHVPKEQEGIGQ